jgi:hypothetical protein
MRVSISLLCAVSVALAACSKDEAKRDTPPPGPPPPSVTGTSASASKAGGCKEPGENKDTISTAFFERAIGDNCLDPQGEVRPYGEQAKYTLDEVCTTAFDGGCELYKNNQVKRVVSLHYIDGSGKGRTAEVVLSKFADMHGAYSLFTSRIVSGADPLDPSTPRPLAVAGVGAIGTGRAYVWKGAYLAELSYLNENEKPEDLAKSSLEMLTAIATSLAKKLPGGAELPPSAAALPEPARIPLGIAYYGKDAMGLGNVGPLAMGFYKDGDVRYRVLSLTKDSPEQAKDVMKTLRARPGSQTVPNPGSAEDAFRSSIANGKDAPKSDYLFVRKGAQVFAIGDDEFALRAAGGKGDVARVSKEMANAKASALFTAPAAAPKK